MAGARYFAETTRLRPDCAIIIYSADMEDLRQRLDELIDIGKQILSKLAEL